jgi:hypothetical protein
MTLQWISIILGLLALAGGIFGLLRPGLIKKYAELFPRSTAPAWILTALCCLLGAREALNMNMGFLDAYKHYIYVIAPVVFIASVVYMKELLAPRALGGLLLLIAVPILQAARWHESAWRLVVVVLVYLGIIYGLLLLLSPWWFRKTYRPVLENEALFKAAACGKAVFGLVLLLLGILVY